MFFGKERRGAPAEVNGPNGAMLQLLIMTAGLGQEGVDELGEVSLAGLMFVK